MKKIAVIGAGPAGCSAAYHLRAAGIDVDLFDKAHQVGGRTARFKQNECTFDTGAAFFTNFYPLLNELVDRLGLRKDVLELERRVGMRYQDQIAEFAFGDFSTFWGLPFLSTKDKLSMIWNTIKLTIRRPFYDLVDPNKLSKIDERSIADWAREDMTEAVYQYCIRPGVEPFWYFSCEDVSRAMTTVLQANAADAKFYTFKNGMSQISYKLSEGCNLYLNTEVNRIEKSGDTYQLFAKSENKTLELTYDGLIMACTADVSAVLLNESLIDVERLKYVQSQKYVANIHVAYMVDRAAVKDMLAYYYPCGNWETPIAAIVLHKTKSEYSVQAPDGKELISVYLLNKPSLDNSNYDKETLGIKIWEMARAFESALPEKAECISVFNRSHAIPLHEVGRFIQAQSILDKSGHSLQLAGDYLSCATVEGALRSGRWAANQLMGIQSKF